MKYRYIKMTFPDALSKDQEGILGANLDSIRDDTAAKLQKILDQSEKGIFFKGFRSMPGGGMAVSALQGVVTGIMASFHLYVFYEKTTPNEVVFYYARDKLSLIKLKQGKFISPIRETLVIDGLKRFVFKDMGIDANKVIFERGDIEKERFVPTSIPSELGS